jgi:hypothetical protein
MRLAVLLGALVLMSISTTTADCSVITETADRLACYDNLARWPAPHPFRGATAPALNHSL